MRSIAVLALILLMAGCATQAPVIREPVTVTRYVYVPIRSDLTAQPASVPSPRNPSGEELLRVTRERKGQLLKCYGQLDAIGIVQGTEVKP